MFTAPFLIAAKTLSLHRVPDHIPMVEPGTERNPGKAGSRFILHIAD